MRRSLPLITLLFALSCTLGALAGERDQPCSCKVVADVVAFNTPWQTNRLGSTSDRRYAVYSVQTGPQRLGFSSVFVLGLGFEEMKPLGLKAIAQTAGPLSSEKTTGGPCQ